jgi:hypothetical protein
MTKQTSRKTADAGYEPRTRQPKDMELEERQAVLMSQARTRESSDISSNASHKD